MQVAQTWADINGCLPISSHSTVLQNSSATFALKITSRLPASAAIARIFSSTKPGTTAICRSPRMACASRVTSSPVIPGVL